MSLFGAREYMVMNASTDDNPALADLHARSFPRGWSESEIDTLSGQNGLSIRVARLVGKPGLAPVAFNFVRTTLDEAEILSIAVDPAHRRQGLGELLIRDAVMQLRAERVSALFLEVDEENAPAVSLYQRLGFETVGMRPAYYAPHVEQADQSSQTLAAQSTSRTAALVMRLDLDDEA